jgi:hypothetical protein
MWAWQDNFDRSSRQDGGSSFCAEPRASKSPVEYMDLAIRGTKEKWRNDDHRILLQLRILRFGLLQDGNVGVGLLPEGEEILISGFCFGDVALHGFGAT